MINTYVCVLNKTALPAALMLVAKKGRKTHKVLAFIKLELLMFIYISFKITNTVCHGAAGADVDMWNNRTVRHVHYSLKVMEMI